MHININFWIDIKFGRGGDSIKYIGAFQNFQNSKKRKYKYPRPLVLSLVGPRRLIGILDKSGMWPEYEKCARVN